MIKGIETCSVEPTRASNIPKLPLFIGRGYNILTGNPLNEGVDPGYQHEIFKFSYKKNSTT